MKKLFYLILIVALAACQEENVLGTSGSVNLNIEALFAGNPLAMNEPYSFGTANQVQFDQFNFFISGVTLLEAETEDETDLLEVALADFGDNAAGEPETFSFRTVPAVKYRGLKLGIGVPSGQNKASSGNFGAGHPLRQTFDSHFHAEAGSYFFMKLAGAFDLNGDGVFGGLPEDHPFELFPYLNKHYKTVTILHPFEVLDGGTLDLNLSLDVLKLLQTADNQVIDLSNPSNLSTYNPENTDLSALLMGNFQTAIEME